MDKHGYFEKKTAERGILEHPFEGYFFNTLTIAYWVVT